MKQLYLTHVSRRYRERDVLEEAQRIFPATIVARDFDHYTVVKDKEKEKEKRERAERRGR